GRAAPGPEDLLGEAVREGGEGAVHAQPGELPVAGGGVLARRDLAHLAVGARRPRRRRHAEDGRQVAEPVALKPGPRRRADGARGVAEGVGALIAIARRVGELTAADRIHDDEDDPLDLHRPSPQTMATEADAPMRLAPARIISSAWARVRTPPEALTPM